MKNLLYISFSLLLLVNLIYSCTDSEKSPVGTWGLESVEGEELTESEKSSVVEFKEDGSVIRKRGDRERKGKWELKDKDDKKYLVLMSEEGEVDEENEIVKLDDSEFVFKNKGKEVTLKKK